jgi:hypothetical protein
MTATTIEQSKHLFELGLDPNTADMNWWGNEKIGDEYILDFIPYSKKSVYYSCLPAWSLQALLEVMPIELEVGLLKTPISGEYFFSWWTDDHHMGDDYKEPIDAAYEMVHWLLENGYIKTKEK